MAQKVYTGKVVTEKGESELPEKWALIVKDLIVPRNVSAESARDIVASVRDMHSTLTPVILAPESTLLSVPDVRKGKTYWWSIKFSDLESTCKAVEKTHAGIEEAERYIRRPNLPSSQGMPAREKDDSLPVMEGLY